MKSIEQLPGDTLPEAEQPSQSQEVHEPENGRKLEREPFDFLLQSDKIHRFMEGSNMPMELKLKVHDLLLNAHIDYQKLQAAGNQEEFTESLITLASTKAGLEELRDEVLTGGDENITNVQRGVLASLFQPALLRIELLPLPRMEVTPEEGAKQLQTVLKKQTEQPYLRLAAGAGEKAGQKVEQTVQSWLERFAGKLPSHERDKVIQAASKLSGHLAFGVTVFGLGFLALGSGIFAAFGEHGDSSGVTVTENEANNTLEIKSEDTGETMVIVPFDQLDEFTPSTKENKLYERLTEYDRVVFGVNYQMSDPEKFQSAIIEEAPSTARELFNKDLSQLTPSEFIKVVNYMVQMNINYDYLILEEDAEGYSTTEANTEDDKISTMPLDEMYLDYGKGVCRHYAALVEQVGEIIINKGLVPQCRGMSIDEVRSLGLMHAWNVYYLNPASDDKKVAIAYTDATWDDDDWDDESGKFFDNLEARDEAHNSIESSIIKESLFSQGELTEIYDKLIELDIGEWEVKAAHSNLARMNFEEYERVYVNNHTQLTDEAQQLLIKAMEHALEGGFTVNTAKSVDYRIDYLVSQGKFDDAIKMAGEYMPIDDSDGVFEYTKKIADLQAMAGRLDEAESELRNIIRYFQKEDVDKWYDSYQELVRFYIKHEMSDKVEATLHDWLPQLGSDYGKIPIYELMIENELLNNHNLENAQELFKECTELAERFRSLDSEQQDQVSYNRQITGAIGNLYTYYQAQMTQPGVHR